MLIDEPELYREADPKMSAAFFKMSRSIRSRSFSRLSRATSAARSDGDGAGLRVIATASRESAELDSVAEEADGERLRAVTADVTREADCARVVKAALGAFGPPDILVNNADRAMK